MCVEINVLLLMLIVCVLFWFFIELFVNMVVRNFVLFSGFVVGSCGFGVGVMVVVWIVSLYLFVVGCSVFVFL